MNNFTNFLNHLNSFPKNKNQLNELNIRGKFYNPDEGDNLGPDRAPETNPLASTQGDISEWERIQENLRRAIIDHKHVPFEELHKERFNDLPEGQREIKGSKLVSAYNAATSENADEDTLMLAAAHNDPAIREAAHNNKNASDNVKGMALWHDTMMEHTENELRSRGIHPADLSKHSSHPQIRQINESIALNLKNLKSNLSVKINKGQNLLKLHQQYLRGEDPEKEQRERGRGPYDTPDRMN